MKILISTLITLLMSTVVVSQITINNTTYSTTQLVSTVLVPSASGTVISNVNFRGCLNVSSRYQAGYFSTATTTLAQMGFTGGVVLSTGNTADIPLTLGANPGSAAQMSRNYTSGSAGEIRSSNGASGQDADAANLIAPQNYYNAAILEFDFVPVSAYMQFRYVFGSEEYDDNYCCAGSINYNCSSYNDKFAFLLSGPGIAGGQGYLNNAINIARLANNSEVGINSVNNGDVGSSGGAPNSSNCLAANPAWSNGSTTAEFNGYIDGTELNGNTKIMTASYSSLVPGQTYHIRLLIADSNDGAYDSVVYLEESSFVTVPTNLPVEFIDFRGECIEKGDELEWFTASEMNNDFFKISKSQDATNWMVIDTILSQGNSSSVAYYSYTHEHRSAGLNYYRLTQVDINGTEQLLKTIAITNDCFANNEVTINFINRDGSVEIDFDNVKRGDLEFMLYDGIGKLVFLENEYLNQVTKAKISIPAHLENGVYYIQILMNGELHKKKILIY
jgi:hypothetical protein